MTDFDRPVPVTMVVTQSVRPALTDRFEHWLPAMSSAARAFPGHLGMDVIRPHAASSEYTIIVCFDSAARLRAWLDSDEAWFSLPARTGIAPARYKMALVTFVAVSSLLLLIQHLLLPLLAPLPAVLRTVIVSGTIVILLTYVILPRITRVLSGWLYAR